MLWNKVEKKKHGKLFSMHWKTLKAFSIIILAIFFSIDLPTISSYENSFKLSALFIIMIFQGRSSHQEVFL